MRIDIETVIQFKVLPWVVKREKFPAQPIWGDFFLILQKKTEASGVSADNCRSWANAAMSLKRIFLAMTRVKIVSRSRHRRHYGCVSRSRTQLSGLETASLCSRGRCIIYTKKNRAGAYRFSIKWRRRPKGRSWAAFRHAGNWFGLSASAAGAAPWWRPRPASISLSIDEIGLIIRYLEIGSHGHRCPIPRPTILMKDGRCWIPDAFVLLQEERLLP